MEAGRSLRDLFAELSRQGAGDPAHLLQAAGFGALPDSLVTQAIVDYAATAPLEVAEHLAPFAVAHGPLPDPAGAADTTHGLSLLASAPAVEGQGEDGDDLLGDDLPHDGPGDVDHLEHASLAGDVDVDPSALDDPHVTTHDPHTVPVPDQHPGLGSFGIGHDGDVPPGSGDPAAETAHDGSADHDVASFPVPDHDQTVDADGLDVSDDRPHATAMDGVTPSLDHDAGPDPHDVMDVDDHHL